MLIIMSVLGAVVMPHNLFLHSEVIQSHEYNKKDDASIKKVLKYELFDTLFSMIVGWAINSAMILLAAATFFKFGMGVLLSLGIALLLIFFIGDPFKGLIISQMVLSIQLPFTVFLQVGLTSSRKVMGDYVNSRWSTFVLYSIAIIVSVLNIMLLFS